MQHDFRKSITSALLALSSVSLTHAAGQIDANTVVTALEGTYNGVLYLRTEAMFAGVTSNGRSYRVPCQMVAPLVHGQGSGLLLFEWLVPTPIVTTIGQEQADSRYTMTDEFLFGGGMSFACVRCDPAGIGKSSPVPDPTRPWSDDLLDTSSEFIASSGDQWDIVADYNRALRTDPSALAALGPVTRRAAFAYSAGGHKLRGLLRLQMGIGLFDFSLVGGSGNGFERPSGNKVGTSSSEKPPLPGAGLEIDFQTETDQLILGSYKSRHDDANYRVYQFAGASHIRDIDCAVFGLPDPELANPAEWTPFIRAMLVAGNEWCDGVQPPPSLWMGAQNDGSIARDAKGNALVRFVGGQPVNTGFYRLPEVAVGQNQYIPLAPQYGNGTLLGTFRVIAGGHVDLTGTFTSHQDYVDQVTLHARTLQAQRYLLEADADAIIDRAINSNIGG